MPRYILTGNQRQEIIKLYKEEYSAEEIKELLNISVTTRSIQRFLKKNNLSRTSADSFRLAAKKGRIKWVKKEFKTKRKSIPPKLRLEIMERDNYKCKLCGATAETTLLEIDHINSDPSDNDPDNLRVLCWECNIGRKSPNRSGPMRSGLLQKVRKVQKEKNLSLCEHGMMKGLCKHGCK